MSPFCTHTTHHRTERHTMKPTTERDSTSIELTDEDGGCIRFDRGEDKDWYAVTSALFVTLTPQ